MLRSQLFSTQCFGPFAFGSFSLCCGSTRTLYSERALGLFRYQQRRKKLKDQFTFNDDKSRLKLLEMTADRSEQIDLHKDFHTIFHLAEQTPEEIDLVCRVLKKIDPQTKVLQTGELTLGPTVIRFFHYTRNVDIAFECSKDQNLQWIFHDWKSYLILLDMLYEEGRYQDVLDVYECMADEQKVAPDIVNIVIATCYKLNSKESLSYVMNIWQNLQNPPKPCTITFAAGLALRQNDPQMAVRFLDNLQDENFLTAYSLRTLALVELGRTEEAIFDLESLLQNNRKVLRGSINREVIGRVREGIAKISEKNNLKRYFEKCVEKLEEKNVIMEESLDETLCGEVSSVTKGSSIFNVKMKQTNEI